MDLIVVWAIGRDGRDDFRSCDGKNCVMQVDERGFIQVDASHRTKLKIFSLWAILPVATC